MNIRRLVIAALIVGLTGSAAMAHPHPAGGVGGGWFAGLGHPWFGLDHTLAMLAVGMLGACLGGHARWLLPTSFVAAMIAGAAVALNGWSVGGSETGIMLSLVALGGLLAARRQLPLLAVTIVVFAFGLSHGHAHGTEIPALASAAAYIGGFAVGTSLLHIVGWALGTLALRQQEEATALRFAGTGIAVAGLLMMGGVL